MKRGYIRLAEKVFQWRGSHDENRLPREDHILELARVVINNGTPLDPLLVLPVGSEFYVIDGHHRLAAYETARWTKSIPVIVFPGDLKAARLEALSVNSKDKLVMTRNDKSEAAWRLVKEFELKPEEVAARSTRSVRLAFGMQRVWRELLARPDTKPRELLELSWAQAQRLHQGKNRKEIEDADEWREAEAKKIVDALLRYKIGQGLSKDTEVTALAIEMLNAGLPGALIEAWSYDHRELIWELSERLNKPDDEF